MRSQPIPLQDKFAKGFAGTKGENNIPIQYAARIENCRISDKGITPRFGTSIVYQGTAGASCQGIYAYESTKRLFRVYNGKFEEVNVALGTITDRSSALTIPAGTVSMFSFDIYIIICTGTTKPYIFNTATNTLTLTTTGIDTDVFPSFGAVFGNFTFLAFKNKLFLSKAVTLGAEANAIERNSGTAGTQQIIYKDYITALQPTLDKLWITTDSFIEYIDANTIGQVGTTANIFSVRFGQDQKMINNECVVPVGSRLFFVTKGFKVRAIGYTQGVAMLQISDISDIPAVGIDYYMQNELDADQTGAFGYFDDADNMIKRHFVKKGTSFPSVMVGFSLVNQAWLVDTGKDYGGIARMGDAVYAYSVHKDNKVFEDNVGKSNQGLSYKCVYESHYIKLGQPNIVKFFRGLEIAGKINNFTKLTLEGFVDGQSCMKPFVLFSGATSIQEGDGIAGEMVAGEPIAGSLLSTNSIMNQFNKVVTSSMIRSKGKGFKFRLTMEGKGQDRIIDYASIFAISMGKYQLNDKF